MKNYENLFDLFRQHLQQYSDANKNKLPAELYGPENYILSLGGKRLRPLLALIACDLFEKDAKSALDSALSVEIFHNFSLIHDDILDAAPIRRNKETVHNKWNTNIAILSGDMMLVKAFQVLQNYPDSTFKQLSGVLAQNAISVCEGQQLDMNFENEKNVSVQNYIQMITGKTAVLLGCSFQMGAICAGANTESQKNIYEFGKHLGISFQLNDDLLDVYAGEEFGKQIGGDIISNKKTYLLLKAMELANSDQKTEINKLLRLNSSNSTEKINGIKSIYDSLKVGEHCVQLAHEHTQKALSFLNKLAVSEIKKQTLKQFSLQLLERIK